MGAGLENWWTPAEIPEISSGIAFGTDFSREKGSTDVEGLIGIKLQNFV